MKCRIAFLDLGVPHGEAAQAIDAAIARVRRSERYILGPELERFEAEFAAYCGVAHAVGVGSGHEALELMLRAVGVGDGDGDEVIVPGMTFVSTWFAVSRIGATPVPVDIDDTGLIDPAHVEARCGPKTRALLPVHLHGHPAAMAELGAIGARLGIPVIADAAQAHGARLHGRGVAQWALASAFSFYPGKNLGALGDAGAVVTDDADLARRVRLLRNYGAPEKHVHAQIAGNSRLDEIQAAILTAKLPFLDLWNAKRRAQAEIYTARLAAIANSAVLPLERPGAMSCRHVYPIRLRDRARVAEALARHGIETQIHYPIAPHLQAAYAGSLWPDLSKSEAWARDELSLPIGPHLDAAAVADVADATIEAVSRL